MSGYSSERTIRERASGRELISLQKMIPRIYEYEERWIVSAIEGEIRTMRVRRSDHAASGLDN
jgi:hypothetical protein